MTGAIAPALDIEFPAPLQCLFRPKRYKVLWGGRGAGRSWGVARALLLLGAERPIRVLCARELQNSIAESVHKVLSDQIGELGLGGIYKIEVNRISCISGPGAGTSFSFEGIKNNTNKIKSYEGIDYCWVEEAVKVSKASWKVLIPTIRKEQCPNGHKLPAARLGELGSEDDTLTYRCPRCQAEILQSEIWMTFNPELETDYTYQRFVLKANPENSVVVKMTYKDNPWFPRVLYSEMLEDRRNDYDSYLNVWEGNCLQMLEGVIYAEQLRKATLEGRICRVPYDRTVPVDTFWDLGRANSTAIWFSQQVAMQRRVLAYYENSLKDIGHYLGELQSRGYLYGTHWLPHDGKAKKLGSKLSIQEQIGIQYPGRVRIVPRQNQSDGINAAKLMFPNCWFDEDLCEDGLKALRHYRHRVVDGQLSNEPLHDWASDGADAFRTMAMAERAPRERSRVGERLARAAGKFAETTPGLGWLAG